MKNYFKLLPLLACGCIYCSCDKDDSKSSEIGIPETDIAEEIVGEWVYDHPEEGAWQSMKFVAEGSYFCYSDNKENWQQMAQHI